MPPTSFSSPSPSPSPTPSSPTHHTSTRPRTLSHRSSLTTSSPPSHHIPLLPNPGHPRLNFGSRDRPGPGRPTTPSTSYPADDYSYSYSSEAERTHSISFAMPKWLPRANQRNANASQRPYGWRVFWSYLPDWVLTVFLWGIFYLIDKIDGYRRLFSVTDESLAHPYAEHERIPVWLLAVTCGIAPALIIVVVGAFHRSLWDIHTGLLGLVLSLGLGVTFTDIIKITVGRPRPDLFSRCQLPAGLTSNPTHGLTSWTVCTQTEKLQEGFRSFPSGHSSFGWTGMWYLELYLMAKLRVGNQRGHTYKSWILLIPVSASTLVSISRTMDYRHHATDVIAGAIIGVIVAWWGYRQYYPPIVARKSWQPYVPRVPRDDNLPLHSASAREHDRDGLLRTSLSPTSERRDDGYPPRQYAGGTTAMGMTPIGGGTGTGTGVGMGPGTAGATENGVPMGYARDGPAYPGAAHTHNAPVATNV